MTYLFIGLILVIIVFKMPYLRHLASKGKYEHINAHQFQELISSPNTVVLDVRQPAEVALGKIEGAKVLNVMSSDFAKKVAQLPKDKTYLVYCRSGNRSALACGKMAGLGFEHLHNLEGGYEAWKRAF